MGRELAAIPETLVVVWWTRALVLRRVQEIECETARSKQHLPKDKPTPVSSQVISNFLDVLPKMKVNQTRQKARKSESPDPH